jgi:hypothetical protein
MLNRASRPQKKTILKLAEALQAEFHELWPDIQVVEMLAVKHQSPCRGRSQTSCSERPCAYSIFTIRNGVGCHPALLRSVGLGGPPSSPYGFQIRSVARDQ